MYIDEVLQYKQPTFRKQVIDLICGSVSGFAYCLSGYGLDTVKVRMQTQPTAKTHKIILHMIQNQGLRGSFNGIYYPLTTVPFVNAVVFGSYQLYKKIMNKTQLSFLDGIENGSFSGFVNSFIVSPVQYIKCVMQTDKAKRFANSKQCLKYIIKKDGFIGLFKGLFSTIIRQVPCYAGQFATYQYLKSKIVNQKHPALTFVEGSLIGGAAGVNCWLLSYPQDLIKTKIQVSQKNTYKKHKFIPDGGFISCMNQIYHSNGLRGLGRGIQPCILRAFVANAFGIAVYEKSQQLFNSYSNYF